MCVCLCSSLTEKRYVVGRLCLMHCILKCDGCLSAVSKLCFDEALFPPKTKPRLENMHTYLYVFILTIVMRYALMSDRLGMKTVDLIF